MLWSTLALLIPCSALAQFSTDLKIGPRVVQFGLQRIDTEIGTFSVPERYAQPRGRKITLAFIRYKATTANPGTPVLYLAGGPGTSGIDYVTSQRFEPYLALREFGDVIALDQRGTGHSEPNLVCPTAFDYAIEQEATVDLLTKSYVAFATSCASYWKDKKVHNFRVIANNRNAQVGPVTRAEETEPLDAERTGERLHVLGALLSVVESEQPCRVKGNPACPPTKLATQLAGLLEIRRPSKRRCAKCGAGLV